MWHGSRSRKPADMSQAHTGDILPFARLHQTNGSRASTKSSTWHEHHVQTRYSKCSSHRPWITRFTWKKGWGWMGRMDERNNKPRQPLFQVLCFVVAQAHFRPHFVDQAHLRSEDHFLEVMGFLLSPFFLFRPIYFISCIWVSCLHVYLCIYVPDA